MKTLLSHTVLLLACGLFATACNKSKANENSTAQPKATAQAVAATPPEPPNPASEAKRLFQAKCTVCHGTSGHGDGPGAQALDPKPRNFADKSWQGGVTDEQISKIITEGGPAVGKSAGMPPNPDLAGQADVLSEMVKLVRGFGG